MISLQFIIRNALKAVLRSFEGRIHAQTSRKRLKDAIARTLSEDLDFDKMRVTKIDSKTFKIRIPEKP